MILNCVGCEEEFAMACELVEEGYHLATTEDDETVIGCKGHFCLLIVNDKGNLVCW